LTAGLDLIERVQTGARLDWLLLLALLLTWMSFSKRNNDRRNKGSAYLRAGLRAACHFQPGSMKGSGKYIGNNVSVKTGCFTILIYSYE
jgi:hypothetical protein